MLSINKLIVFCSLAVLFLQAPLCTSIVSPESTNKVHNEMVNGVIRKYLTNYKKRIVEAERDITKKLNDVVYDIEHRFHHFVQNTSIRYDLDKDAVNDCIQREVGAYGPKDLSSENCHYIAQSHRIDYKYGNLVNFGNFTRAVRAHCKNFYNSNTKQRVEKCVNDAGPAFIKKQKATVNDVKRDGEELVKKAKACGQKTKAKYYDLEKKIYKKCRNS